MTAEEFKFQSTLPARGATWCNPPYGRRIGISIHAPRTGSDRAVPGDVQRAGGISIHAPRTGSDSTSTGADTSDSSDFNPRSPHGERRQASAVLMEEWLFQSTLPARGAT